MAVENRDLGTSQQRETYQFSLSAVATGGTVSLLIVPFPATVAAASIFPYGVSNTPTGYFDVTRFNSAGVTTITGVGSSLTLVGATVPTGWTISSGASIVNLQTGDLIVFREAGTNANITGGNITVVLQALQDIKKHFGA